MSNEVGGGNLVDRLTTQLKNNRVVAVVVVCAAVFGGLATFGDNAKRFVAFIRGDRPASAGPLSTAGGDQNCASSSVSASAGGNSVVIQCATARDITVDRKSP